MGIQVGSRSRGGGGTKLSLSEGGKGDKAVISYHRLDVKVPDRFGIAKLVYVLHALEYLVHALPCKLEVKPGPGRFLRILGLTNPMTSSAERTSAEKKRSKKRRGK